MKTPRGIKFIALLLFMTAALNGVVAAIMIEIPAASRGDFLLHVLRFIPPESYGDPVFIFFLIGTAIGSIVIGFGLCLLKSWARWTMLFITVIPLGRGAIGACETLAFHPHAFWKVFGTAFWVWMLGYAAIAYYLIQPEVQKAFSQDDWELRSE